MYDVRRWRLEAPMYDVQHARRPQAAAGRLLMYDCKIRARDAGKQLAAVSADGQRRSLCPAGANRQSGAGELINVRIAHFLNH